MTQIILEFLALSVVYLVYGLQKENICISTAYLSATIITVYLLYKAGYVGDMLINAF
jgi:nicotinamide mononucleotide transporter